MAGHSKWHQIRHKKSITDKKRGQIFSKLLKSISIAAKNEPNPQFNPALRSAIEKAKESQVPQENIERAVKRASENSGNLENLLMEAYGPEGVAILIEAITDNRNRTTNEVKNILKDYNGKWADPGSVIWAFDQAADKSGWEPKYPTEISEEALKKLEELLEALDNNDDVCNVIVNANF